MQAKGDLGGFISYAEKMGGAKIRQRSRSFFDHFSQAALFWHSQSEPEQAHIVKAFRFELGKLEVTAIRERMIGMLSQVDPSLAKCVAQGLGLGVPTKPPAPVNESVPADGNPAEHQLKPNKSSAGRSPALSMANSVTGGIKTRRVAILASDGVDDADLNGMKKALLEAGAQAKVVAPRLGMLNSAKGAEVHIDFSFLTSILERHIRTPENIPLMGSFLARQAFPRRRLPNLYRGTSLHNRKNIKPRGDVWVVTIKN